MHVAIVGGGIAGLTTALYLQRAGISCRVFEATAELKPLGVGLNLFSHAVSRLADLGVEPGLRRRAVEPKEFLWFNQFGQLIHQEPAGVHQGYRWSHYSVHRADLHAALLEIVEERLGSDAVELGRKCVRVDQDDHSVTVHFESGPPERADLAIGCDGFHSAVRRQYYPNEKAAFGGINMWRGVTVNEPILSGASLVRAGPLRSGKFNCYPIRNLPDGRQLMNWLTEVRQTDWSPNDWSKPGKLEDFIHWHADWHFDWLDVPDLIRRSEFILEYPMCDRDPVDRWTFGRITLLGDAAHPMYPRGGNGAAQSILDAECVVQCLTRHPVIEEALKAYEAERLPATSRIVLTNRSAPPDAIIETVDQRTGGKPFDRVEDVISESELRDISESYKRVAAWDLKSVNGAAS
jgi:2-polyprenyl-6-methoxyphenol hydroxylase-like FAD-dependent oxidoreductase